MGEGVTAPLMVRVTLRVRETVGDTLRERDWVKDMEGVMETVEEVEAQAEVEGVPLPPGEALEQAVAAPEALGEPVARVEAEGLELPLGQEEEERVRVGAGLAEPDCVALRERLGEEVAVVERRVEGERCGEGRWRGR